MKLLSFKSMRIIFIESKKKSPIKLNLWIHNKDLRLYQIFSLFFSLVTVFRFLFGVYISYIRYLHEFLYSCLFSFFRICICVWKKNVYLDYFKRDEQNSSCIFSLVDDWNNFYIPRKDIKSIDLVKPTIELMRWENVREVHRSMWSSKTNWSNSKFWY